MTRRGTLVLVVRGGVWTLVVLGIASCLYDGGVMVWDTVRSGKGRVPVFRRFERALPRTAVVASDVEEIVRMREIPGYLHRRTILPREAWDRDDFQYTLQAERDVRTRNWLEEADFLISRSGTLRHRLVAEDGGLYLYDLRNEPGP